jgi:hypothetical protein
MDEAQIRQRAEAHAEAVVDGDLGRAASDLAPEAQKEAAAVMKLIPNPVRSAQVRDVNPEGDALVAGIVYAGPDGELLVRSRWEVRDGRPMIVSLSTG